MTKRFNLAIILTAVILSAACNNAATDPKMTDETTTKASFDLAAAKSAIEAENMKFIDDFKKGDSVAVAAHYADDALVLAPNMEPVKASDLAAFWGSFMKMGIKDFKLIMDDLAGNAEQLVETGRYELYDADNKLMDKGKYVVAWKAVNGGWKLYRDIFNSSMPAASAK